MTNEILRQYPLEPIVRREFLKRASLATLVWGASPRVSFAQTAATGSLLIQGGLIVTSERQFLADIRARAGKIEQIAPELEACWFFQEALTLTPICRVVSRAWPAGRQQP
jgi:hypothetical protein